MVLWLQIHFPTSLTQRQIQHVEEGNANFGKATCFKKAKQASTVFISLEGKTREAVLELDIAALNFEDGMEKVYVKLVTHFLENINQSTFLAYETFKGYQR